MGFAMDCGNPGGSSAKVRTSPGGHHAGANPGRGVLRASAGPVQTPAG